jgi:hypothetical protein
VRVENRKDRVSELARAVIEGEGDQRLAEAH